MNPPKQWNGRRYYSLDTYLKETFGTKLYKLSLDGGMNCPNRDGTLGTGGCIFCSAGGSGDFSAPSQLDTDQQLEYAKNLIRDKYKGDQFIAYFQSYTNTYANVDYLEQLFLPIIQRDDIAVLSIATRPDCLEPEKLKLLERLTKIKPVWVELGLQTMHQSTADLIHRGYTLKVYDEAVRNLHAVGVKVITHIIVGLPNETESDMIATARHIGAVGSDGIKIQLLHILKHTELYQLYTEGKVQPLTEDEYVTLVAKIIAVLPPTTVIHRMTGDGNKEILVAPLWSGNKRKVLNHINHTLKVLDLYQGKYRT